MFGSALVFPGSSRSAIWGTKNDKNRLAGRKVFLVKVGLWVWTWAWVVDGVWVWAAEC